MRKTHPLYVANQIAQRKRTQLPPHSHNPAFHDPETIDLQEYKLWGEHYSHRAQKNISHYFSNLYPQDSNQNSPEE